MIIDPLLSICNINQCSLLIQDQTLQDDRYLSEKSIVSPESRGNKKMKFSESYTVNVIKKVTSEKEEIVDTIFSDHIVGTDDSISFDLDKDGYYMIYHYIIPSKAWIEAYDETKVDTHVLNNTDFFYSDGISVYQYFPEGNEDLGVDPKTSRVLTTEELLAIDFTIYDDREITMSQVISHEFSICKLYECYIRLCKLVLRKSVLRCIERNKPLSDILFRRDFLWMTVNVLRYLVEMNSFMEAQRIIEELDYCGGICNDREMQLMSKQGCGCHKT